MYPRYEDSAHTMLKNHGFQVKTLSTITGGSNHYVFAATLQDGTEIIIKFPKIRETELTFGTGNKDTLFGGDLSLKREAYLFDLIRTAGLPTPKVFGIYPTDQGDCIVVERSPGCNLVDYMNAHEHRLDVFLKIIQSLGTDFMELHKTSFEGFGNILEDRVIEPAGLVNFADRYLAINEMILSKCYAKGGLTEDEYHQTDSFFKAKFSTYYQQLNIKESPATLVITDLHGDNFFVDHHGISGYFDVESSQAAPLEYELYCLRFFVFNFYGEEEFNLAEAAFWRSYSKGTFSKPPTKTHELIDFFSACRLLEIFQSYWGHVDGLRDTWGQRIKAILFDYMATGTVNYLALGAIWRERDHQPTESNKS